MASDPIPVPVLKPTKPLTLLSSGVVLVPVDQELVMPLTYKMETIYLKIVFKDDASQPAFHPDFSAENSQTAKFTFYNYKNPLGTFLKQVVRLGTLSSAPVWMLYKISGSDIGAVREFMYSFFLEEGNDGTN